jgi:hypothetical protein
MARRGLARYGTARCGMARQGVISDGLTPIRLVICGSRSIRDQDLVEHLIELYATELSENGKFVSEVIEGGAKGVDEIAGLWACKKNIPVTVIEPQWRIHGLAAGPIRNEEMVKLGDAVIAIWNGRSRGTASTINYAKKHGKPVKIWQV